jgi:hypothetical protein
VLGFPTLCTDYGADENSRSVKRLIDTGGTGVLGCKVLIFPTRRGCAVAPLSIPKKYQTGVSQIRLLDEETATRLRAALDGAFQNQKPEELAGAPPSAIVTTALTSVPSPDKEKIANFKPIAEALAALYRVKSKQDVTSIEDFAGEVCDAMESLEPDELRLRADERERVKNVLVTLLSADMFAITSKAYDLMTDDERTFCHARILTDLRPVFGHVVEEGPKAMVVVHLLQVGYHQGNEKHQQFYVSLDADDLEDIRRVIDRAQAKAKTLKSVVKDIRIFGIPREE